MYVSIGKYKIEITKENGIWVIVLYYKGEYYDEVECNQAGALSVLSKIQIYQLRKVAS